LNRGKIHHIFHCASGEHNYHNERDKYRDKESRERERVVAKLNGDSALRSCEFKKPLPYTASHAHTHFAELTAAVCLGVECPEIWSFKRAPGVRIL